MPLVKTEGVVLQQRPFSETSKILVIFTRDNGRVSLLFKGGRKGSKKFPGGLETLNRVGFQYYHRDGRELQNFRSFDLIESYPNLRSDLKRTYTGLSIAETILRTTAPEDSSSDLFYNMTTALDRLDSEERHPWDIRWKCLLEISQNLGFGMGLEGCSLCGSRTEIIGFDLANGGFICKNHQIDRAQVIPTSGEIWGVLRFLAACPYDVATRMTVTSTTGRQIEALFLQYYIYHIPGLKSFESWKKLPGLYWEEN